MDTATVVTFWIMCGIVGLVVASSRGAPGFAGFLLGLLLGPLGLIVCFVLKPVEKAAPSLESDASATPVNLAGGNDTTLYRKCGSCGSFVTTAYAYCQDCGASQSEQTQALDA